MLAKEMEMARNGNISCTIDNTHPLSLFAISLPVTLSSYDLFMSLQ